MRSNSICLVLALLTMTNCFFTDEVHKSQFSELIASFTENFKERFNVIALGEMDWHSKMELGLGYWITAIKIRGIQNSNLKYDPNINGFVLSAPEMTIELLIEDQYTIPIKVNNFELNALLYTDAESIKCTQTSINYDGISLDINPVVEYVTKQFLNLEVIKSGIKMAEIPLRNLIGRAFRDNRERVRPLVMSLKRGRYDSKDLLRQALTQVHGIVAKGDEFWLNTRTLFEFKSLREAVHLEEL